MQIKRFVCGSLEANGYVIYTNESKDTYIIDPGYSHKKYLEFVKENGLEVKGILLTHHHHDHAGKADILANAFDCPVYAHRAEISYYKGMVNKELDGGEIISFGDDSLEVIHTPGHTAGGVCYFSEKSKLCFTGDTIFNVDLGRVDLPGGSLKAMTDTVNNIIDKWGNDITIYPGHGDSCTMKYVRKNNLEFLELLASK